MNLQNGSLNKAKNKMNIYCIHVCENDSARIISSGLDELLESGVEFEWPGSKPILDAQGIYHEWIGGYSWSPYVLESVRMRLDKVGNIQWHGPFLIDKRQYYLMNVLAVTNITKETSSSNKTFFNEDIVGDYEIFRPKVNANYSRKIFVTESFKVQTECAGERGIRFGLIKSDGWEEFPF